METLQKIEFLLLLIISNLGYYNNLLIGVLASILASTKLVFNAVAIINLLWVKKKKMEPYSFSPSDFDKDQRSYIGAQNLVLSGPRFSLWSPLVPHSHPFACSSHTDHVSVPWTDQEHCHWRTYALAVPSAGNTLAPETITAIPPYWKASLSKACLSSSLKISTPTAHCSSTLSFPILLILLKSSFPLHFSFSKRLSYSFIIIIVIMIIINSPVSQNLNVNSRRAGILSHFACLYIPRA